MLGNPEKLILKLWVGRGVSPMRQNPVLSRLGFVREAPVRALFHVSICTHFCLKKGAGTPTFFSPIPVKKRQPSTLQYRPASKKPEIGLRLTLLFIPSEKAHVLPHMYVTSYFRLEETSVAMYVAQRCLGPICHTLETGL